MAGLLRNLLVVLCAMWRYRSVTPQSALQLRLRVTPLDTGIATLKSDRYFQMAEAAQLDWAIRSGLIREMVSSGYNFVNVAQCSRFVKPVRLFSHVTVLSRVAYADDKCAWFQHSFSVRDVLHAEVFVKMKFKKGPVTVPPAQLLGAFEGAKPAALQHWDNALGAATSPGTDETARF